MYIQVHKIPTLCKLVALVCQKSGDCESCVFCNEEGDCSIMVEVELDAPPCEHFNALIPTALKDKEGSICEYIPDVTDRY